MFSALPTVEHEQVLRSFVREEAILRYLKAQASPSPSPSSQYNKVYRLGVRYSDFYFIPCPKASEEEEVEGKSTRFRVLGSSFISAYCDDDRSPRVDKRLLAVLGVSMRATTTSPKDRAAALEAQLDATTHQVTEADLRELEAPLLQATVRVLTLLDVVRTVLFGKGLLTVSSPSSGSLFSDSQRGGSSSAFDETLCGSAPTSSSTPLSEASATIRRRIFSGLLPVPVLENDDNSDSDEDVQVTVGQEDILANSDGARLRSVVEAAYNVAKDEFQCTSGGGIRSSAARSYLVRSVAYMQRIRDLTAQNDTTQPSQGFLWEVARACQECVHQLEELDKNFMFSSARDEFYECVGDIGMDGPTTETVLVVCGEEVKASFAFFQDAAHSLYSWAMNCIEMIDAYEQQGLLPSASTAVARTTSSQGTSQSKTLTSRGHTEVGIPIVNDVSGSYLPLEDRAQSMYEYPLSTVTTHNAQFTDIMSAAAQALQSPPVIAANCPLTARLNGSCAIYVSGQRLLSVPYFSSIRQLILSVERETERVNRTLSSLPVGDVSNVRLLSPPVSRFQFLLDTLRLYYITSVTADEKKTLEHFGSVTVALLSELTAEKALMEANRSAILTSLQARWDAKQREGGEELRDDVDDYYLPDPLLPLYTKEERDTLTVSFGAFFRTRSAIRGLIGALQKDIMRRNRTHGVVMVTSTATTSSARSGLFSASVVPLVVRHYRTKKGKVQPTHQTPPPPSRPALKQQSPMGNTSVRTVSAMESDENYFQGGEGSPSSSLFVNPRHFYESGKTFLVRQGSRLPTLKVPLPTSTLAEWKRLAAEVPVVMRRRIETGCSSSSGRCESGGGEVVSGGANNRSSPRSTVLYPVSMVPVGAVSISQLAEEAPAPLPSPADDGIAVEEPAASYEYGWAAPLRILQGMWKNISCSLSPASEEVQDARRVPSSVPSPPGGGSQTVFKGPPKSVVSPLVYRKEALLIALIDADNEAQRMHEALTAEYPTLYASGSSCASAERMKTASMRFAAAFMPPAAAAAAERDEERGPVVEGILGTTDRIISTIQSRTRALLDLAEVRKRQDTSTTPSQRCNNGEDTNTTLLSHVAKVAQQYSIVFDPPK